MFIGLSHAGMQQTGGGGKGHEFANTKHQVSVTLSTYKVLYLVGWCIAIIVNHVSSGSFLLTPQTFA